MSHFAVLSRLYSWPIVILILIPSLTLILLNGADLALGAPLTAQPDTPIIIEPEVDGQILNPEDVHMETLPLNDPDGDGHFCSDWQIVIASTLELVWEAACITGLEKLHVHLGDGNFQTPHTKLQYETDYKLRVRHRDDSLAQEWSNWAERPFVTGQATAIFPLELDDVIDSPAPKWRNSTNADIILPAGSPQPFLRLESHSGTLFLEFSGNDEITNNITNPPALSGHLPLRIHIDAGNTGSNLIVAESEITFTDDEGTNHTVYLPVINLAPAMQLYLWVSANGSTYLGNATQTEPDFSELARGAPVPWQVADGFKVEIAATGFQLPINIAFVPEGFYPGNPDDPLYYVTELYGKIKVVSHDRTVSDYATNLLNFNPTGNFPGSGEQGVTGIVVDPATGNVFASMLYDSGGSHYPKIVRFQSTDGGKTASSQTTILDMVGETQGASHQISKLTIGPDGKLYAHMGDGGSTSKALDLNSFRGKILRLNLDGTAPSDNPFYDANNGINARDYIYAYGFRNPFGGAWRQADGHLYEVENGPSVDRLAKVTPGTSYGWSGLNSDMEINAIYNWDPSHAPVDMAFIQTDMFNGSGFPAEKLDHAFVTESGPTWATGPTSRGKRIVEFVLDNNGDLASGPTTLVEYNGSGKATAAGVAAGPDGLYFTDLYKDLDYSSPIDPGANILRVKFVGIADLGLSMTTSISQVVAGSPFSYTIQVTNGGPFSANNVVLTDTLSPEVSFVSSVPPPPTCNETSGIIICDLGNLDIGDSSSITIQVHVPLTATGTITNEAIVTSDVPDNNIFNNEVSLTIGLPQPIYFPTIFK